MEEQKPTLTHISRSKLQHVSYPQQHTRLSCKTDRYNPKSPSSPKNPNLFFHDLIQNSMLFLLVPIAFTELFNSLLRLLLSIDVTEINHLAIHHLRNGETTCAARIIILGNSLHFTHRSIAMQLQLLLQEPITPIGQVIFLLQFSCTHTLLKIFLKTNNVLTNHNHLTLHLSNSSRKIL